MGIMNTLGELSGHRGLQTHEEVFVAYATHSIDGERSSSGPVYVGAIGPEARQLVVDWILEDTKIVDYLVKPVEPKDYLKMRAENVAMNLALVAVTSSYQISEEDYSGIYYD